MTDSPLAETNYAFSIGLTATYGAITVSQSYSDVVQRNGTEKPVILVNHTDITSGVYGIG